MQYATLLGVILQPLCADAEESRICNSGNSCFRRYWVGLYRENNNSSWQWSNGDIDIYDQVFILESCNVDERIVIMLLLSATNPNGGGASLYYSTTNENQFYYLEITDCCTYASENANCDGSFT